MLLSQAITVRESVPNLKKISAFLKLKQIGVKIITLNCLLVQYMVVQNDCSKCSLLVFIQKLLIKTCGIYINI